MNDPFAYQGKHAYPYAPFLDSDREYDGREPKHRAEVSSTNDLPLDDMECWS